MNEQMRIGEALLMGAVITKEQLEAALALQREMPAVPLGFVLSDHFGVPVEDVDHANVKHVLLPRFRKLLLTRLLALSRGDKFAKGLDMIAFVTRITTIAEVIEVVSYNTRQYQHDAEGYFRKDDQQGFVTRLDVTVKVETGNGEVDGMLHAEHDSRTDTLVITDDEVRIKENIYYGVRSAFRSQS